MATNYIRTGMADFRTKFWPVTYNLFLSNLKAKYVRSILGPAWLILEPALFISITTLVFSHTFENNVGSIPYALFVMPGLLIWSFFFSQTQASTSVFLSNRELLTNTTVPKEAIIFSKCLMGALDYLVRLIILLVWIWIYTGSVPVIGLIASLLVGVNLLISLFGISMLLAISNTYYRDFSSIVPILLQLFFYASPVIYPLSVIPTKWLWLIQLNPVAIMIEFLRSGLFENQINLVSLGAFSSWSLGIYCLTWLVFKKFGTKLVEEL